MPIVVSNHQRIYFRYEGERGAFLMLHHGLFGSHQDWYEAGYVEELAKEFRLVIPDARGHGRSDRPAAPEDYRPQQFAEDVIEIMNSLGVRNLHFLGYGLGALIGLETLRRFPDRVRIAVLGGESPLVLPPMRDQWRDLAGRLESGTLAGLLAHLRGQERLVRWDTNEPDEAEHAPALALLRAMSEWEPHGEERIAVTSPVTLFAGAGDPVVERVERARTLIHRARLVIFPGQTHAGLFTERTLLTQELVRLLKSGRREDGEGHGRRPGADAGSPAAPRSYPPRGPERRVERPDRRPPGQREERRYFDRRGAGPGTPGRSKAAEEGTCMSSAAPAGTATIRDAEPLSPGRDPERNGTSTPPGGVSPASGTSAPQRPGTGDGTAGPLEGDDSQR